jgi:hypothetical protein
MRTYSARRTHHTSSKRLRVRVVLRQVYVCVVVTVTAGVMNMWPGRAVTFIDSAS